MQKEELIMNECLKLAEKGKIKVNPNPLVGCIILKHNKIIGKGYHKHFGGHHAEINAIHDALSKGYNLKDSHLFVNLEPCSHHGKTPPCTDLIIKNRIKKVYIGMKDPNPLVKGTGIKILIENGIEVYYDILTEECKELNRFFIKYITKKLPYVTLKIAQSIDGNIALQNNKSKWITSDISRKFVHKLRSNYDAILIGKNTAKFDNPVLTTHGKSKYNPKRFVFDRTLSLNPELIIFKDKYKSNTFRLASDKYKNDNLKNIIYFKEKNAKIKMLDIMRHFYNINISSILIEGGANLFSQFIKQDLFDDIYFIVAPIIMGRGISPFESYIIKDLKHSKKLIFKNIFLNKKDLIVYNKKSK
jgi:diaminohydroxyphosphoribosylaminopyrimidine deaminase / 5-amino-6-(5-phosphoribosylamino)uracil reductase